AVRTLFQCDSEFAHIQLAELVKWAPLAAVRQPNAQGQVETANQTSLVKTTRFVKYIRIPPIVCGEVERPGEILSMPTRRVDSIDGCQRTRAVPSIQIKVPGHSWLKSSK